MQKNIQGFVLIVVFDFFFVSLYVDFNESKARWT